MRSRRLFMPLNLFFLCLAHLSSLLVFTRIPLIRSAIQRMPKRTVKVPGGLSSEPPSTPPASPSAVKKAKRSPIYATSDLIMPRDPLQPLQLDPSIKTCKILCWNVAGLRGTLKNSPLIFQKLVETHAPDVICLQEVLIVLKII